MIQCKHSIMILSRPVARQVAVSAGRRPVNNRDSKPLFSLYSYKNQKIYSMDELTDIHELCQNIHTPDAREAVYIVYNLDSEMIEKYYDIVMYLEKCLTKRFNRGVTRRYKKKK